MKILYKNDTKKVADQESYDELVRIAEEAFNISKLVQLGENIKFYYMDHEGDIISVTHQKDLDEARSVPSLRMVIARDVEDARQILSSGPASIMNMSLN